MRVLRVLCVLACFFVSAGLAANQELRPITHEEVWLAKRLGDPVVSPDGQRIVLSQTEPSYEEDGDISDLWLLDVSGQLPGT